MTNEPDWKWYAGSSEGVFEYGPFDTREDAIDAALCEGLDAFCFVIEAYKIPLKLSGYVHAVNILEHADACAEEFSNESGDAIFEVSSAQQADLDASLKATVDAWQARHGVVFMPCVFTRSRNEELVDLTTEKGVAE